MPSNEGSVTVADFFAKDLARAVHVRAAQVAEWPIARRIKEADRYADLIAGGADGLWADAKTARKAAIDPADVRQAIVDGLAILAHRPGGADFGGLHWCRRGHPECPGRGDLALPAATLDRASRGAFFTPRELADRLAGQTLTYLTDGAPSMQVLGLRVCDPAVGTGALLVAVCRYLAARLVTAWRTEAGGAPEVDEGVLTQTALRLVQRCCYGVDVDPLSVELARLAIALLAPASPDVLKVRLVVGDSLVGYGNVQQLLTMDPGCFPPGVDPLHWPLTFPEVFVSAGRPPGFDAVVSNPPFLGGGKLTGTFGVPYREYLVRGIAGGARGCADLSAYFALRAHDLVHCDGSVGIVATNTLAQGDTREVGLDQIVAQGWDIWDSVKSAPWPNRAVALHYCMVWTAGGPQVVPASQWPKRPTLMPAIAGGRDDYERSLLHAVIRMVAC